MIIGSLFVGASESRHGKEAEARDVNTRKNKEYWRSEMFRLLPAFAARHDTDIEAKKAALQTLVDQSFEQAQPNGGCCSQPMLQPSQRYDASYVSLTCSFKFEVKVKKCASCNMTVIAQPLHCGCFGSTPEHPHVWFDLAVFPAYAKLALGSGVSSTVFVQMLNEVSNWTDQYDDGCNIDAESFSFANMMYCRTFANLNTLESCGVPNLPHGPLQNCQVCAHASDDPEYCATGSMDAVLKCGRFANVGNAAKHLQPHGNEFFGEVEKQVKEVAERGSLGSLPAFMAAVAPSSSHQGDVLVDGDGEQCSTRLSCARTQSRHGALYDRFGIIGTVCIHGIPLLNSFCDLRGPENFVYYMLMLLWITMYCSSMSTVYVDFGCRLSKSWERLLQRTFATSKLTILVNWMHGASHDLACQIQNCGRFRGKTAWSVGEQIEQLWSLLKPAAKLVKYMTPPNRRDFLEFLLAEITRMKRRNIVSRTAKLWKSMLEKKQQLQAELSRLTAQANSKGISLQGATDKFIHRITFKVDTKNQMDNFMNYVRFWEMKGVSRSKKDIVSSGAKSIGEILIKGAKAGDLLGLENTVVDLKIKLDIPPTTGHGLTDQDYCFHLAELTKFQVCRWQDEISELVHDLTNSRASYKDDASLHDNELRRKSDSRKHTRLDVIVCDMRTWLSSPRLVGSDHGCYPVSSEEVAAMLRGEPSPWEAGGQHSGEEMMLGRKHFMASNDLDRCKEQLEVLVVERQRLHSYFARTLHEVDVALAEVGEFDLLVPDRLLTVNHGKVFRLRQHKKHLLSQAAEAEEKLSPL